MSQGSNRWEEDDRPFPGDLAGTIDPTEECPSYWDDEPDGPTDKGNELLKAALEAVYKLDGEPGQNELLREVIAAADGLLRPEENDQ